MIDLKLLSEVPDDQLEVIEKSIAEWISLGKPKILGFMVEANTDMYRCAWAKIIMAGALIAVTSTAWGFAIGYISDKYTNYLKKKKLKQ